MPGQDILITITIKSENGSDRIELVGDTDDTGRFHCMGGTDVVFQGSESVGRWVVGFETDPTPTGPDHPFTGNELYFSNVGTQVSCGRTKGRNKEKEFCFWVFCTKPSDGTALYQDPILLIKAGSLVDVDNVELYLDDVKQIQSGISTVSDLAAQLREQIERDLGASGSTEQGVEHSAE